MNGTREHIKGPNGQSSTMILCLISNGGQGNLASFSWPPLAMTMTISPYNGKGNVEGGHEEVAQGEVGDEKVGYCVQPPSENILSNTFKNISRSENVIVCSLLMRRFFREYIFL